MTIRTVLLCLSIAFLAGACNQTPTIPDRGSTNAEQPGGAPSPLSDGDAEAIALSAVTTVAKAVASVLPVKDLQAIYEAGHPLPACPSLKGEIDAGNILLTLDYGGGCTPALYRSATFAGRIEGVALAAYDSFDLALIDTAVDGESMIGSVGGRFEREGRTTSFRISIDVTLDGTDHLRGNVTADVDDASRTITVREGGTTTTNRDGALTTLFDAVTLDLSAATGAVIVSGVVEVRSGGAAGASGASVAVVFGT
jgi:hypothetical protein